LLCIAHQVSAALPALYGEILQCVNINVVLQHDLNPALGYPVAVGGPVRLIKKYANRRLYDTETSAYINLAELAELVRGGMRVKVVGVSDGADLTQEVLLQVVLEQLQGGGLFTVSMLHRMIRSSGDDPWQQLLRTQLGAGMELLSAQMDQVETLFGLGPDGPAPPKEAPAAPTSVRTPACAPDIGQPTHPGDAGMAALRERLADLEERLKSAT
jgi:polyhydroxyalkanoate synthesis repressor PhaR